MCVSGQELRRQALLARTQEIGIPDRVFRGWGIVVGVEWNREK